MRGMTTLYCLKEMEHYLHSMDEERAESIMKEQNREGIIWFHWMLKRYLEFKKHAELLQESASNVPSLSGQACHTSGVGRQHSQTDGTGQSTGNEKAENSLDIVIDHLNDQREHEKLVERNSEDQARGIDPYEHVGE